jgi:hypothetical protein
VAAGGERTAVVIPDLPQLAHPDLEDLRLYPRLVAELGAAVDAGQMSAGRALAELLAHPDLVEAEPCEEARRQMVARHLTDWWAIEARLWEWDALTSASMALVDLLIRT